MKYAHITLSYSYTLTINTICCVLLSLQKFGFCWWDYLGSCFDGGGVYVPHPKPLKHLKTGSCERLFCHVAAVKVRWRCSLCLVGGSQVRDIAPLQLPHWWNWWVCCGCSGKLCGPRVPFEDVYLWRAGKSETKSSNFSGVFFFTNQECSRALRKMKWEDVSFA